MAQVLGVLWSIEWGNPYTDPPVEDGAQAERFAFSVCVIGEDRRPPARIEEFERANGMGPGSGWTRCVDVIEPAPRRLPLASKQSMRRKRLWNRLQKKHPLFADQFYDEELARRPEYFGSEPA